MNTGVGSLSLLQRILLTQELNWGLLHCRQILYQLSYWGSLCLPLQNHNPGNYCQINIIIQYTFRNSNFSVMLTTVVFVRACFVSRVSCVCVCVCVCVCAFVLPPSLSMWAPRTHPRPPRPRNRKLVPLAVGAWCLNH